MEHQIDYKKVREYGVKILGLCIDLNSKGHHAFFDMSGHVDQFEVKVWKNGWVKETEPTFVEKHYFHDEYGSDVHFEVWARGVIVELKKLLED